MSRAIRQGLQIVLIAALVAAAGACGGSSSKAKPAGTTTSSRASSSTTTAEAALTAPATDPAYAKAALQLVDVGSKFANYRKAAGVQAVGTESCSLTPTGALLTTRDHAYSGAMFKKTDATYFAYSETFVFVRAADAKRYAAFRATPAFKQCKVKQDDAATRAASAGTYVKLTPVEWANSSGTIPSMYRELTGGTSDGKQVDNGFYDRYTLWRGRVVVVVNIDSELGADDAKSQALANQTGDILRALDQALTKRLAGV